MLLILLKNLFKNCKNKINFCLLDCSIKKFFLKKKKLYRNKKKETDLNFRRLLNSLYFKIKMKKNIPEIFCISGSV